MPRLNEIRELSRTLTSLIGSLGLGASFYEPVHIIQAAKESERLFQDHSKAGPPAEQAYAAALAFMRGKDLDDFQYHLIAGVICAPVREQNQTPPLGHKNFGKLLARYKSEAQAGDLWRLTWYGLLTSYFAFDPETSLEDQQAAWQELRRFLKETWPLIERQSHEGVSPDWVTVLREERQVFSDSPTAKYAQDYLAGDSATVDKLAGDLGIPPSSWFWHALVLGVVTYAANRTDKRFVESIPRLMELVEERSVFRDDAIEKILERYHSIDGAPVHQELRDYVIRKDVWKNPKLKAAGIATSWNRVTEPAWRMVLMWVNESNLKDFFDILASRNTADDGRLAFWSNYMKQITWTRLIFGSETLNLANRQKNIRELIAREAGAYATLSTGDDVDAFMMQIGEYTIVEFSKKPNAAYIYSTKSLKFNPYASRYIGDTSDLKFGFKLKDPLRIMHFSGWQSGAADMLERLQIYPDRSTQGGTRRRAIAASDAPSPPSPHPVSTQMRAARAATPLDNTASAGSFAPPVGALFTMRELQSLVSRFTGTGARIDDKRGLGGGRLWVEDPGRVGLMERSLKSWGFRWAKKREAWYYPDSE